MDDHEHTRMREVSAISKLQQETENECSPHAPEDAGQQVNGQIPRVGTPTAKTAERKLSASDQLTRMACNRGLHRALHRGGAATAGECADYRRWSRDRRRRTAR
jgi:hypothetical protein